MTQDSDRSAAFGADRFPGSNVFAASAAALDDSDLHDRIAETLGAAQAIAWVGDEDEPRITAIVHDGERVVQPVELPGGLAIAAGAKIEARDDEVRVSATGCEQPATITLAGDDAGVVTYSPTGGIDAWIRYFYPDPRGPVASAPATTAALRYRILPPATVTVRLDPTRPFDPERTQATPAEPALASFLRTRWGAGVQLRPRPPDSRHVLAFDPVEAKGYWTLDGTWGIAVEGRSSQVELALGLSGAEFVRAPSSYVLRFVAGSPAYAPGFDPGAPGRVALAEAVDADPLTATIPGLREPVTTAWLYVEPAGPTGPQGVQAGAGYFSQPDDAGMFRTEAGDTFLRTLPLEAAPLPPGATTPHAGFPSAPYAGLDGQPDRATVTRFEIEVLAAARSQVIYALKPNGPRGLALDGLAVGATALPTGPTGRVETAVTPQGLLSRFSADFATWEGLVLAQAKNGAQQLVLTDIRDKLREALLANRLFLVVSDVDKLRQYCSTTYSVTPDVLTLAGESGVSARAIALVGRQMQGLVYATDTYFSQALDRVLGPGSSTDKQFFMRYSELMALEIGGWTFDLSSWRWANKTAPTTMIVKFGDSGLESLIGDLSRWTLPSTFNDDPATTQTRLLGIASDARSRVAAEPELRYFVEKVLATAAGGWNGVLFLSPAVPTKDFPPEVEALAAGLPERDLRAHHLGVTLSSFDVRNGAIELSDSSLFGLILYESNEDLVYSGSAYDFKVLSLRVLFENSAISSFSSQVELLVGQLFNELATLEDSRRGDNIVFEGTLQRGVYRFTSSQVNRFSIASHVLAFVEVTQAQFVTVVGQSTATRTVARFVLAGTMGFRALEGFDLFGYGPEAPGSKLPDGQLGIAGLMVSMEFDPNNPKATRSLEFVAGQTTFDVSRSAPRRSSLPARFPLTPAALRQSERKTGSGGAGGSTPAQLGFIPVAAPVPTGQLGDVWFGIELTLNFGSAGGLAPRLGFSGALLLSWAPAVDAPNVAVGLRLPGSSGGSKSLTIMGPLKLSIGQLNLLFDAGTHGYVLRLANVALSFLGLSFPSGGRANALVFGDPDPAATNSALGWYLAYAKDKPKPKPDGPQLLLAPGPDPDEDGGS